MTSDARITAGALLWILVIDYCLAAGMMLFGVAASGWEAIVAVAAGFVIAARPRNGKLHIRPALATLIAVLGAAAVSMLIPDASYDGNAYHQDAVALFLNGWNPVKHPSIKTQIWVLHYSKGAELTGATFAALFGFLEQAKMVNVIMAISAYCAVKGWLDSYLSDSPGRYRSFAALVAISAPPAFGQIFTFYTDLWVYYCILWLAVLLFTYYREPAHGNAGTLMLMAGVTILATGTKWTAAFYVALAWLAGIIPLCRRNSWRRAANFALTALSAAVVGVFFFGYHPFITNALTASHPLYPLMGSGAADILTSNTPDIFLEGNRFSNFFRSLASFKLLTNYYERAGGFGAGMILLLVLSIAALALPKTPKGLRYAAVIAFLSCFCFEQSWWARYIPQLWLIVAFGAIAALRAMKKSVTAVCCFHAIIIITALSTTLQTAYSLYPALRLARQRNQFVDSLPGNSVTIAPAMVTPDDIAPGKLPFGTPEAPARGYFLPDAPAVERELNERGISVVYTYSRYSLPYFYWSGIDNTNFASAVHAPEKTSSYEERQ